MGCDNRFALIDLDYARRHEKRSKHKRMRVGYMEDGNEHRLKIKSAVEVARVKRLTKPDRRHMMRNH
jgi:hypothetical protein